MARGESIRMLQISDPHLYSRFDARLLGMDTTASFEAVVSLAHKESIQQGIEVAAVLATGDIAQDSSMGAYDKYFNEVSCFNAPILWLPGNHDSVQFMQAHLAHERQHVSPCIQHYGRWSVIMLDSSIDDRVPGFFTDETLTYLDQTIAAFPEQHILVCMHHHPILVNSKWLDSNALLNPEAFWQVIEKYSNVKAVAHGHIHQEVSTEYNGVPCFSVPSTCIQFKPLSDEFALDDQLPGYRWFDLFPDGSIDTQVSRVTTKFNVDMNSTGY